jgi:ABC-type uncharacterized transport system auxiliary subunit
MKRTGHNRPRAELRLTIAAVSMTLLWMLAACSLGGGRAPAIEPWALDYDPPAPSSDGALLDAALRVERFGGLAPCSDTAMSIEPEPRRVDALSYSRWLSSPADQVADLLERDLAHAAIFTAVFGPLSGEHARFAVHGTVEECTLGETPAGWRARLVVRVALVDTESGAPSRRLVLQRLFAGEEAAAEPTAGAMAAALSDAMADVSGRIVNEIAGAARRTLSVAEDNATKGEAEGAR